MAEEAKVEIEENHNHVVMNYKKTFINNMVDYFKNVKQNADIGLAVQSYAEKISKNRKYSWFLDDGGIAAGHIYNLGLYDYLTVEDEINYLFNNQDCSDFDVYIGVLSYALFGSNKLDHAYIKTKLLSTFDSEVVQQKDERKKKFKDWAWKKCNQFKLFDSEKKFKDHFLHLGKLPPLPPVQQEQEEFKLDPHGDEFEIFGDDEVFEQRRDRAMGIANALSIHELRDEGGNNPPKFGRRRIRTKSTPTTNTMRGLRMLKEIIEKTKYLSNDKDYFT